MPVMNGDELVTTIDASTAPIDDMPPAPPSREPGEHPEETPPMEPMPEGGWGTANDS